MNSNAFDNLHERGDDELDGISDDASLLQLYVAGELDKATRATVAGRLAAEPAFASQHAAMAMLDARLTAAGRASSSDLTAAQSDRVLHSTLQLVREQTILLRQRRAAGAAAPFQFHAPGWAWATAAAAALAVGFVVWVTNTDPRPEMANSAVETPSARELSGLFFTVQPALLEDDSTATVDPGDDSGENQWPTPVRTEKAALAQIDVLRMLSTMDEDD